MCVYACVCLHACAFVCVHVNTSPFLAVSLSPGSGTLRGLLARALPEAHPWPTLVRVSPKRRGRQEAHHRALKLRGTGHDTSFLPCLQLPLDVAPNTRVAYLELKLDLGLNSSSQAGSSVRLVRTAQLHSYHLSSPRVLIAEGSVLWVSDIRPAISDSMSLTPLDVRLPPYW